MGRRQPLVTVWVKMLSRVMLFGLPCCHLEPATAGNVFPHRDVYNCSSVNNTLRLMDASCQVLCLIYNGTTIYIAEGHQNVTQANLTQTGFYPPILDHPSRLDFIVEGCPTIVYYCLKGDIELRSTYVGVLQNATAASGEGVENGRKSSETGIIAASSLVGLFIIVIIISFICYKRFGNPGQILRDFKTRFVHL